MSYLNDTMYQKNAMAWCVKFVLTQVLAKTLIQTHYYFMHPLLKGDEIVYRYMKLSLSWLKLVQAGRYKV